MRTIVSEYSARGMTVQNVVYQWRKGDELEDEDSRLSLKYLNERRSVKAVVLGERGRKPIGRVALSPPNTPAPSLATDDEDHQRSTLFYFDGDWSNAMLRKVDSGLSVAGVEFDVDLRNASIDSTLVRLGYELSHARAAGNVAIEALVQLLFADLARHVREEQQAIGTPSAWSSAKLDHIRQFVAQAHHIWPTVAEVAAECSMSASHLCRLFKRETGVTLQDYLIAERADRAQYLLRETDLPLKIISHQLGFNHISAFTTAFRKEAGMTPSRFRQAFYG